MEKASRSLEDLGRTIRVASSSNGDLDLLSHLDGFRVKRCFICAIVDLLDALRIRREDVFRSHEWYHGSIVRRSGVLTANDDRALGRFSGFQVLLFDKGGQLFWAISSVLNCTEDNKETYEGRNIGYLAHGAWRTPFPSRRVIW